MSDLLTFEDITAFRRKVCGDKWPEWTRRIEALHLTNEMLLKSIEI